jgi:hypothetical protein
MSFETTTTTASVPRRRFRRPALTPCLMLYLRGESHGVWPYYEKMRLNQGRKEALRFCCDESGWMCDLGLAIVVVFAMVARGCRLPMYSCAFFLIRSNYCFTLFPVLEANAALTLRHVTKSNSRSACCRSHYHIISCWLWSFQQVHP